MVLRLTNSFAQRFTAVVVLLSILWYKKLKLPRQQRCRVHCLLPRSLPRHWQHFCYLKKWNLWIYIRFQVRMKGIHAFQTSTTRIYNLNSSSHPLHPSERRQACYSLFAGCARSKFLPTREQQGSSQHDKLSRAVDSGGCIPNRWRHHGHKPESCQPLGRRGFCITTQGNLGEWFLSRSKLWVHKSLLWEWWTNHSYLSLLGPRCPPW